MYEVSNSAAVVRGHRRLFSRRRSGERVNRTVVLLGLTSLFTDVSSEMVTTVLPLYLVYVGGFSPLAFGFIDGLYQGAAALVRLASGFIGDRRQRHKAVAGVGYAISAACKLALALVGTAVSAVGAIVLLDRIGKGIRTAPRDAMISLSTPPAGLGAAFGVHRALDTTGAMLGPLVAFGLLALIPLGFDTVFLVSFLIAVIGLGILVLLVQPAPADRTGASAAVKRPPPPSLRAAFGLLRGRRFRALMIAGGALSLATASDAFLFLILEDRLDLGTTLFPLLFVGSAGTYMLLAVPVGRLADRIGRGRVLLGGYALLLAVYAVLLSPLGGVALLVCALGLLGAYYAATDGVLMALGSALAPDELRGSGLALIGTATSVARLLASIAFGALWTLASMETALACFAGALVVAMAFAAVALVRSREVAHV
ncbi:MAG: MFS transporter [Solirubrobacteraceae bacterium]